MPNLNLHLPRASILGGGLDPSELNNWVVATQICLEFSPQKNVQYIGDCTTQLYRDHIGIVHILPNFNWVVATQICFIFTPKNWGNDPIWRLHIFQRGWFNHQLDNHLENTGQGGFSLANFDGFISYRRQVQGMVKDFVVARVWGKPWERIQRDVAE